MLDQGFDWNIGSHVVSYGPDVGWRSAGDRRKNVASLVLVWTAHHAPGSSVPVLDQSQACAVRGSLKSHREDVIRSKSHDSIQRVVIERKLGRCDDGPLGSVPMHCHRLKQR